MNAALPEEVRQQLTKLQTVVGRLEQTLQPFQAVSVKEIDTQLEPLQRAEVYLALSRAVNALFQLFLQSKGVDPDDHPARKEAGRLQQYGRKVAKAVAEKELREARRTLHVDVAAMSRFIAAAVPDLPKQQQQALRNAGTSRHGVKAANAAHNKDGGVQETLAAPALDEHGSPTARQPRKRPKKSAHDKTRGISQP